MCFTENARDESLFDRRKQDAGPPCGFDERRTGVDRRVGDMAEISIGEWLAHAVTSQGGDVLVSEISMREWLHHAGGV